MRYYLNGDAAVYDVSRRILQDGIEVGPRGLLTRELQHECFVIERPFDCIPVGIGPGAKLSLAMAALESLQNIAGEQRPDLFKSIAPASSKFAMLVYGERLAGQMPQIEAKLRRDPDTRQAVATVWHEDLLGDEEAGSNHCAVSLQFLLRRGELDLAVYMRSNDAFWGLTYNLVQFGQVLCTLAGILDVDVGRLYWHATSMHLYKRHWPVVEEFVEPVTPGLGRPGPAHVRDRGANLGSGRPARQIILRGHALFAPTDTEKWFHEQILPHVDTSFAVR